MEFTKEEISLCKQIAEKHRKTIKYGDWFCYLSDLECKLYLWKNETICNPHIAIPLWTISDCLEFLREREVYLRELTESRASVDKGMWYSEFIRYAKKEDYSDHLDVRGIGKTPLKACLKAVLAVLREVK